MNLDKNALHQWYNPTEMWENCNGDEIVELTWMAACNYKDNQYSSKIAGLEETIEYVEKARIAFEQKLEKVFKDAKSEIDYRDKKIAFLEAECERVYHPIREFWNQEKDEEMKSLKKDLNEAICLLSAFLPLAEGNSRLTSFIKRMTNE